MNSQLKRKSLLSFMLTIIERVEPLVYPKQFKWYPFKFRHKILKWEFELMIKVIEKQRENEVEESLTVIDKRREK